VSEQQGLIDLWDSPNPPRDAQGRPMNRPPYLYAPRRPASSGLHTRGTAIDTSNPDAFHKYGEKYGFLFLYAYDKVHFEYNRAYDKMANENPSNPNKPSATANLIGIKTVDIIISYACNNSRNGITVCAPKHVKKLSGEQWGNHVVQQALKGVPILTPTNDREYDILTDMYR
jgi:hypothetical protein